MANPKRIAIIGAGASGLAAIKSCKEEGFIPVCYERNGFPGGMWRYNEEDIDGVASVMKTTIINTSKEICAFSDFPPPEEFPNFMHNSKVLEYFMLYAETFDLLRHIRYHLEVIKVGKSKDYENNGCWTVTLKCTKTEEISREKFDAIMVCIGHHVYPNIPTFPGQQKFKGTIIHSHSVKTCERFNGQKIAVIGIGNSGVDVAVNCTFVAEQVYLSTRRGSWIVSRVGPKGEPYDLYISRRRNTFLWKFLSYETQCKILENKINGKFDHAAFNLKPQHRILSAHPTVNDALPNFILSGRVIVKGDVERFEENGVVFSGDKAATKVDSVILATGYEIKFPFIDSLILSIKNNRVHLYKYAIPPNLKHHNLAFIGLIQPFGPIVPIAEMHCRWFAQIMAGKLKLPTQEEMERDIEMKNKIGEKRFVNTARHTIQVDWIPFMDELSEVFAAKPNLLKLAVTDPKLFWVCFNGACLPYQYRLQGPHSWQGAREAILNYEDRVYAPFRSTRKKTDERKDGLLSSTSLFPMLSAWVGFMIISIILSYLNFPKSLKNKLWSKIKRCNAI